MNNGLIIHATCYDTFGAAYSAVILGLLLVVLQIL